MDKILSSAKNTNAHHSIFVYRISSEVILTDWNRIKSKLTPTGINFKTIQEQLRDCPDIKQKKVHLAYKYEAYFIYVSGLIDTNLLQKEFIRPVVEADISELTNMKQLDNLLSLEIERLKTSIEVIRDVMSGNAVLLCPALEIALSCSLSKFEQRDIEEPITEKNIRGPHEGFVEPLNTNIAVLRRKIKNNRLKFRTVTLGTQTNQTVAIAYIEGVANIEIVESLYDKISSIEIDGLSAIGYVEQCIITHPYSLFPQFLSTERPDRAMAALLEGRLVVLQEGTPVVMIAPVEFLSFFQALDDYSTMWMHGSFLRLVRLFALFLAITLPSFYIAVTTFHYYAVPLNLLIPLAESRAKVPFPPLLEVLIMETVVEMIREAAVRLPTYIGTAIGVFASLVIGQAAVEAGIVSNILIVLVAASAVGSYVIPSFDMSMGIRILRFFFTLSAGVFGIIGIVICTGLTLVHLVSLDSLGQPYLQPFAPLTIKDLKDTVLRFPLHKMSKRPSTGKTKNESRGRNNGRT